jgi:hypothetical protein
MTYNNQPHKLGVFAAMAIVLTIMGLLALIANYFGLLPTY